MKKRVNFITEIASTHYGDLNIVKFLSDWHIKSNSQYLKFQIFRAKNLYKKSDREFKKYKKIQISFKSWKKLIDYYSSKTKLILEPFDKESYEFCKQFKKKTLIKVSTSETDNKSLIDDALQNFKYVFLNLSGYSHDDIKKILSFYKSKKNKKKLILMYGFQAYPTKPKDLRFNLFTYFKKQNFKYGYADHSINGLSKDLVKTSTIALNKKCSFIEKHICKSIAQKPLDYISALEPAQFEKYLEIIEKNSKKIKFKDRSIFSQSEKKYATNFHKIAFAKKEIKKNTKIDLSYVDFFRSKNKDGIKRLDFFIKNIKLKRDIPKGSLISKRRDIYSNVKN